VILSAIHAEVAFCWSCQTTNIRDCNQNQHAERRHCELESYDEQGGIEF